MTDSEKELLAAATLIMFQRVKNATHVFELLMRARDVASSMVHDDEWNELVKGIDSAVAMVPIEAERFVQNVLGLNSGDWDHFTGLDYDHLADLERQERGLPAFDFDSYEPFPSEQPIEIIRRLKGLSEKS